MDKKSKRKRQLNGDYRVGYCRPPESTQFKKGQSGNPGGRPRNLPRVATTLQLRKDILTAMEREVTIVRGGKTEKVPAIVAAFDRLLLKALNGHYRSLELVIQLRRQLIEEHSEMQAQLMGTVLKVDEAYEAAIAATPESEAEIKLGQLKFRASPNTREAVRRATMDILKDDC